MEKYIKDITEIISEINEYETFDEDTNLIESEILSSLTLMYLITELEDRYDVIIEEEMITPEKFSSVVQIAETLKELL